MKRILVASILASFLITPTFAAGLSKSCRLSITNAVEKKYKLAKHNGAVSEIYEDDSQAGVDMNGYDAIVEFSIDDECLDGVRVKLKIEPNGSCKVIKYNSEGINRDCG